MCNETNTIGEGTLTIAIIIMMALLYVAMRLYFHHQEMKELKKLRGKVDKIIYKIKKKRKKDGV